MEIYKTDKKSNEKRGHGKFVKGKRKSESGE
jgi:hypothetical protein